MTAANISQQTSLSTTVYRLMQERDVPGIVNLLKELKANIMGLSSASFCSAICSESLSGSGVVVVVADEKDNVIGFSISIIEWKSFFKAFFFKHPLLGGQVALNKLWERTKNRQIHQKIEFNSSSFPERPLPAPHSHRKWTDSSPQIARVIYTAVAPGYQRRGIATVLGDMRDLALAERRVIRVDALVDPGNSAMIQKHQRDGSRLEGTVDGLLFFSWDIGKLGAK